MKIYFDGVNWEAEHTGPNCFAKRLAVALGNLGHQIADPDDYDVALVFIEPTGKLDHSKPFVQRLDGIWFKPDQMTSGMNDGIKRCYETAASVVWQSAFDRSMTSRWFGSRSGYVIRNGIDIAPATIRSQSLKELRERFDMVFVSAAQWHPQKRLRDNLEVFKKIRGEQHPRSCLIVLGSNPDPVVADPGIFYAGSIRHDLCAEVYATADRMIHCAWLDHCPNSVCEAIAQGCPVLCTSEGGTKELVMDGLNGDVIQDSELYWLELTDYDSPPPVPLDAIPRIVKGKRADPSTVDIVWTAREYERVLREALER